MKRISKILMYIHLVEEWIEILMHVHPIVKWTGKLQDGTVFNTKGHNSDEDTLEVQTDEGRKLYLALDWNLASVLLLVS